MVFFLLFGLIPLIIGGLVSYFIAKTNLEEAAFKQLSSVQQLKKNHLKTFFFERMGDAKIFSEMPFVSKAIKELDELSKEAKDKGYTGKRLLDYQPYKNAFDKYYQFVKDYKETYEYYDVFLFSPNSGRVLLTVALENDFGTELKFESHHLAKGWQKMKETGKAQLIDMAPYAPSNDAPAMFIVQPAFYNGNYIGAIGLQISDKAISDIMQSREGMGQTGESYLVGPDLRMRSNSYLDPQGHSLEASFAGTVENNGVDTKATREVFAGRSGKDIIKDYNGNPVLSVYSPLKLYGDVTWAIIAEIDEWEAFAAVTSLRNWLLIIGISMALIVAFLGIRISRQISDPIVKLARDTEAFKNGDNTINTASTAKDEIGKLSNVINEMIEQIGLQISYLDNLPTPVFIIDKEYNVQYMNKFGCETVGKSKEECLSSKCYDLMKADHCKTEQCRLHLAMKEGKTHGGEHQAKPNGKNMDVMYTGSPIFDRSGNLLGAMEYVGDITAVKEGERYLSRNTKKIMEAMELFAHGDLTVNVEPERENDDMGRLARGFNKVVSNIKEMIMTLRESIEATAAASTQISSSAEELATGAQEQSSQSGEVASAVEEMASTILETNKNISNTADKAKLSQEYAEEGNIAVHETIEGMERISEVVNNASQKVQELGESSDQIGEIIQVIDEIADQTNLLALNAAIEAARAGEQGRGFAVVADEVRKLAERTSKATTEIAAMIKKIQQETGQTVEAITKGNDEVIHGIELANKAGDSLRKIKEKICEVLDLSNQVAAASEQQSSAAEQISRNVEAMSTVAQESAAGTEQIARATNELNELTEKLTLHVQKFKIDYTSKSKLRVGNDGKLYA